MPDLPTRAFETEAAFEAWLHENQDTPGLWLRLAKKASGRPSVTYKQALEHALRYGWIDGQAKSLDAEWTLRKFTPRARRSIWSKINVAAAEALIASGRMQPRGQAEVDRARADGRWAAAYTSVSKSEVPPDLQAALDANSAAKAFFATLNSRNRFAFLHRLETAKKPETRAKRLADFTAMLARGEVFYPAAPKG